ncbi:MAG: CPBP family intramembrane metalloprotease [Lachnospiraceae bacterium]|nr:CPBP family intramembrane metalloprotease [Lachnospiraceae bacterium]
MNEKPHKILDHPILSYFLLFLFAEILVSFGTIIDTKVVGPLVPGYLHDVTVAGYTEPAASGVGVAVGALVAIAIFALWFKPKYWEVFTFRDFVKGLLMILPVLIIHYIGSLVSCVTYGTSNILLAFLFAFAPGFGEETAFRILGVSNYMRTIKSEKGIKVIFWLSTIFFALAHAGNVFVGADPVATVIQVVYTVGIGMILGAVYLRTGNMWAVILAHMSVDFLEFCRADIGASGGVMTGIGIGDWITVVAAAVAAVLAWRLVDRKHYPEIMDLWKGKWNK